MLKLILHGITVGLILPFLIGPVFFSLIETSMRKGFRSAFFLELGILLSDLFCLVVVYIGSRQIAQYIDESPWFNWVGGLIIVAFGISMFYKKIHVNPKPEDMPSGAGNDLLMISKGFVLNIVNPGVVAFWMTVVLLVGTTFSFEKSVMITHFVLTFGVVLAVDLAKIYFARKLKMILSDQTLRKVQVISACLLITWGVFIHVQGYFIA